MRTPGNRRRGWGPADPRGQNSLRHSSSILGTAVATGSMLVLLAATAAAEEKDEPSPATGGVDHGPPPTAASETPTVAYTHSAFGVRNHVVGAAGYGESRGGFEASPRPDFGGGLR